MGRIKNWIVNHPKIIISIFLFLSIISAVLTFGVQINTDTSAYLPKSSNSKQAMDKLNDEFGIQGNTSVLIKGKSIEEVLEIIMIIEKVDGVKSVIWLDDYIDPRIPDGFSNNVVASRFYKDGNALLTVMFDEGNDSETTYAAVKKIEQIAGSTGYVGGPAAISKNSVERINREIPIYMAVAVVLIIIILLTTTSSWIEPIFFMTAIGVAILLNMGTNIFKGSISQVTFAAASLLQLAVSMDYSIFLLHRFHEERAKGLDVKQAMMNSIKLSFSTIIASSLTTLAGFMALLFMQFGVGADMGIVLAKGIVFSLVSVFAFLPALIIVFDKLIEKFSHKELRLRFEKLSGYSVRIRYVLVGLTVVIASLFFAAQIKTQYYYSNSKMLPANDKAVSAIKEIETAFGTTNQGMLLLPSGDKEKEREVMDKLSSLDGVTNITGLYRQLEPGIPEMMLPENISDILRSGNYSLVTFDISHEKESQQAFDTVERVRTIASEYYSEWYASGESFVYKDMKDITNKDFLITNVLSVIFIFLILLVTFKSVTIPVIAVLVIEMAIWINLGFAYFNGEPLNFLSSIIIGAIQLGATVDYAILFLTRYRENLAKMQPVKAAAKTFQDTAKSILTSGAIVVAATFSVYYIATIKAASEICLLIGRGALISMFCVLFVLPGFLVLFNRVIKKTTISWPSSENI